MSVIECACMLSDKDIYTQAAHMSIDFSSLWSCTRIYSVQLGESVYLCLTRERTLSTMCAIWRQVIKRIKMFRPIVKTPRINMMERKKSNISRNVTKKSQLFVSFFFQLMSLLIGGISKNILVNKRPKIIYIQGHR